MTDAKADIPLEKLGSCPAWVNLNDHAKGYYLPNYQGGLLQSLTTGEGARNATPAERVDLIAGVQLMVKAGRLSAADGLRLVETFHADPERDVVQRALSVALAPALYLVPDDLLPNYARFLQKNFQARAHELGWNPHPGESDDVRLLRPSLLSAMATFGGDTALAAEARKLADEWLEKRQGLDPEVLASVLSVAGFHGDLPLMRRFLSAFQSTKDAQDRQRLMQAMLAFRDPKAIEAGMQMVSSGKIPLADGFLLIIATGQNSVKTRKLPFEFIKQHFDRIMAGNPSIFGFDFGGVLPRVGASFCDAQSRNELQAFFGPIATKYTGAPRNLAQILEAIDLCIASKTAQQPSVVEFLSKQ
jgi:alanyl aminopeptidase